MMPLIQYGLGISDDKVVLRYCDNEKQSSWEKQKRRVITSVDDFARFMHERMKKYNLKEHDIIMMCSSSMDFPEDSTDNKATIKLARALR